MKIKLLKPYGLNERGAVLDVGYGVAQGLVTRGIAEYVAEKPKKKPAKLQDWVKK